MNYAPDSQQVFSQPKIPQSYYEVRSNSGDSSPIPIPVDYYVRIHAEDISFIRRGIIFVPDSSLESKFNSLVAKWRRDTSKFSLVEKSAMHWAYQRIIGMGYGALPLIFRELDQKGGHWLWALEAITGRDDVAKQGDTFRQAVSAWLQWGRSERYL
jgi:hypothetical protein